MFRVAFFGWVVLLWAAFATGLEAQPVCRTGKPCGNTCIARNKTCRVGTGTARAAPSVPTSPAPPTAARPAVPEGSQYVASSRGRVYYWIGCAAWRSLSPANLRYFPSREAAETAGYTPSRSAGCAGPAAESIPPAFATAARPALPLAPGSRASCHVLRIVDGDTIECAESGAVRLLLIDAPEMDQGPFGAVAKTALEGLLPIGASAELEIDVDPDDQYGRTLAYVRLADGRTVNEELLRMGVAVVSVYPPNMKYVDQFRAISEDAKEAKRGLWALNAFECLPEDHRAGRCE